MASRMQMSVIVEYTALQVEPRKNTAVPWPSSPQLSYRPKHSYKSTVAASHSGPGAEASSFACSSVTQASMLPAVDTPHGTAASQ